MPHKHYHSFNITFLIIMSFLGLLFISVLTIFPPTVTGNFPWRKPLIGSIFSSICVLGIVAIFSPTRCSKILKLRKKEKLANSSSAKHISHGLSSSLQGHHPRCGKYVAHIFQVRNKTFCAACVGLLVGGLVAFLGTVIYFFNFWTFAEYGTLFVLVGSLWVGLGLFQFKFRHIFRLFVNTFFVLGALLILIGIDKIIRNLFIDFFVISLIKFWLITRISLSQLDHEIICSRCLVENCSFKKRR